MPKTPEQLIEQTSRHAVFLERTKTQYAKEILDLLSDVEASVLGRLARVDITNYSRARLEKLLTAIRGVMDDGYNDIWTAWRKQIIELADYEAGFEVRSLQNVVANFEFTLPTENQIMTAAFVTPLSVEGADKGKLLEPFFNDWSDNQKNRVTGAIRSGFAQGQTTQQVISGLRDVDFPANERGLSAVVRTGLQHAANQARQATWDRNSDIVKGVRWISTLDSRTSTQCQALSGREFPLDKGPRPAIHINCRSTVCAILDERYKFLDEDATQFSRTEDGVDYVNADLTYYQWLKKQSADFQDAAIGPTRGKLLRKGGLSSERFAELQLGKNFQALSLAEMKRLEPVAFQRAGIE